MAQILQGRFGFNLKTSRSLRPLVLNLSRMNFSTLNGNHGIRHPQRRILQPSNVPLYMTPRRTYAMIVARILRGALKLRYLVLGGAIG
uniref:Uncharacterized protein n=2 Tax=Phlebotomus papatasi TaxID=29031 RepID=A0A1B0DCE6_PHLPP